MSTMHTILSGEPLDAFGLVWMASMVAIGMRFETKLCHSVFCSMQF